MALSYVWGQVKYSKALKSNLEDLQRPGSLSVDNDEIIIPRTIRHAMRLVALSGKTAVVG
jgi:hypothetical protein